MISVAARHRCLGIFSEGGAFSYSYGTKKGDRYRVTEKRGAIWMKKNWKNGITYLMLFSLCFLGGRTAAAKQAEKTVTVSGEKKGELAILIDDFGYCGEGTAEMLALPIPFTAAVMPFSSCTASDGEQVRQAGKELFIHMPMESLTGKKEWVGEKGVFRDMSEEEIRQRVEEAFSVLPDAVGLNNHMGSAIMEDQKSLSAVMDVLKEKNALFVDSMTTAKSLGKSLAAEKGVPFLGRDVFLDSTDSLEQVKANLRKAAEVALEKGEAVAIGHVGPEGGKVTAQAIQELIPELEQAGIVFVTVSELAK